MRKLSSGHEKIPTPVSKNTPAPENIAEKKSSILAFGSFLPLLLLKVKIRE